MDKYTGIAKSGFPISGELRPITTGPHDIDQTIRREMCAH